jgi:hypothetical protein
MWAVINGNATLQRSSGGVTVASLGGNGYQVTFNRDVRNCAYVAAIGGATNDIPAPGFAVSTQFNPNPNSVQVNTFDSTGLGTGRSFHLIVTC